jgi:hypothetical protein
VLEIIVNLISINQKRSISPKYAVPKEVRFRPVS